GNDLTNPATFPASQTSKGRVKMNKIKIAAAVAMLLASPALAQPSRHTPATISDVQGLPPPGVDHIGVRASALHWGMTAAEVALIMGTPSGVDSYTSEDVNGRVLDFLDELTHQGHHRQRNSVRRCA